VIVGLVLQLMDVGLFGENPIPKITAYNQIFFWGGIGIWAIGQMRKGPGKGQSSARSLD